MSKIFIALHTYHYGKNNTTSIFPANDLAHAKSLAIEQGIIQKSVYIQIFEYADSFETPSLRLITCDCDQGMACPQGRVASQRRCQIWVKS